MTQTASDRGTGATTSTALVPLIVSTGLMIILFCCLVIVSFVESFDLSWVSTLLLATASICFLAVKLGPDFDLFHPTRLFGFLWCLCLALCAIRLLPMISEWNALMWVCVLTALVSFTLGAYLAERRCGMEQISPGLATEVKVFQGIWLPERLTLIVSTFCILAGGAVLAYEYHLIGAIPIFADDVDFMRTQLFGVAGQGNPIFDTLFIKTIHFFVEFIKYGVFFAFVIMVQRRPKTRTVLAVSGILFLFGTLIYISQAGRMFLIDILVTCVVLFHYLRRRIRFAELMAALLILFLLLGLAGSLRTRTGTTSALIDRIRSDSGLPEGQFWDGIGFGYLTLTESFEVFYRLTTDLRNTTKPAEGFLFYSVHRIIPRANLQEFAFNLYSGLFVTPTYMGEFYADFGVPGILLGSLALGLLYGWVYVRSAIENNLFWLYLRAMLIQMLFFFPYVNLFSQYLNWIVDPIFMFLLIYYLESRRFGTFVPISAIPYPPETT